MKGSSSTPKPIGVETGGEGKLSQGTVDPACLDRTHVCVDAPPMREAPTGSCRGRLAWRGSP